MFKVVPDQLRVSEGWVRCGQCSEVFDANLHLQSPTAPVAVPATQAVAVPEIAEIALDMGPKDSEPGPSTQEPFLEVNPRALYIDPQEVPSPALAPQETPASQGPRLEAEPEPMEAQPDVSEPPDPEPEAEAEAFHHAFLKPTPAPLKPVRPFLRVILALFAGGLFMALLLQVAVQERDRIVAAEPAARHVMEPLCAAVGCVLAPLRQIESVVIDSSSFTKLRGDVYRLNLMLKNTAPVPLATPALELTLTDLQDQAVVRRVFQVTDFAEQPGEVMQPGAELTATVTLKVASMGGASVSGYRLLSFYP